METVDDEQGPLNSTARPDSVVPPPGLEDSQVLRTASPEESLALSGSPAKQPSSLTSRADASTEIRSPLGEIPSNTRRGTPDSNWASEDEEEYEDLDSTMLSAQGEK